MDVPEDCEVRVIMQKNKLLTLVVAALFWAALTIQTTADAAVLQASKGNATVQVNLAESLTLTLANNNPSAVTLSPSGTQQCVIGCPGGTNVNPITATTSWMVGAETDHLELCAYWSSVDALAQGGNNIPAGSTFISTTLSGTFVSGSNTPPSPISTPLAVNGSTACGTYSGAGANPGVTASANLSLWKLPINQLVGNSTATPPVTSVYLYVAPPGGTPVANGYNGTLNFVLQEVQ